MKFFDTLPSCAKAVNSALSSFWKTRLSVGNFDEMMQYSLSNPGKFLRAAMCMNVGEEFLESAAFVGGAIEMIHLYSLVHDDLPCMDDSDFRRGKPSVHKEFGEAEAVLFGDGLLTGAFEMLSSNALNLNDSKKVALVNALARFGGFEGLVGGQLMDIKGDTTDHMQRLKTGKLFAFSCVSGGIIRGFNEAQLATLENFGIKFGLLYQICDDISDGDIPRGEGSSQAILVANECREIVSALGNGFDVMKSLPFEILSLNDIEY